MPLISGTVPSLINGVSQQPATLRMNTQGEAQQNGLSHIARGLEKRPCTEHVSQITGFTSADSNDVFIHTIRRSEDEAYALIIKGGTTSPSTSASMKLIDLTGFATGTAGNEVYIQKDNVSTNITSSASLDTTVASYLGGFSTFTPNLLSSTTIADFTFILNKSKKIKKIVTATPSGRKNNYEGLVYLKVGDFGAEYKVTINLHADGLNKDATKTFNVTFTSPDNKTESLSGPSSDSADRPNMQSINNQNSVLIHHIAEALKTGAVSATLVPVKLEVDYISGSSGGKKAWIRRQTGSANYEGDSDTNGCINAGTVATTGDGTSDGLDGMGNGFTVTREGSVLQITNDTNPFTIEVTDGKGDTYMAAITGHDEVPKFSDLPASGVEAGFVARVSGDKNSGQDDYYVKFNGAVYKETFKPEYPTPTGVTCTTATYASDNFIAVAGGHHYSDGDKVKFTTAGTLPTGLSTTVSYFVIDQETGKFKVSTTSSGTEVTIGSAGSGAHAVHSDDNPEDRQLPADHRYKLDNSTMPMQLYKAFGTVGGVANSIYFVCKPVTWEDRKVGDDTTNPFPSFANYDETDDPNGLYTINDIFFHRNRLGFISDENVILSEAAGYFNFFANTVLSVLDTSIIDVAVSNNQVAILKSAIPFQENLLLFSDLQQFKLTSDQFLTPTSVTVDVATNFETSTDTKPVAAGKTIFFPFKRGAFSGIREYMIDIASETNDANEITAHVPEYIEGTVKKMAVSSNEEVLFVLSDTDRRELMVYKYYYSDQEKLQSSWSTWKFDAEIVDVEFIGSVAFILFRRDDDIYLEKLNLSVDNATSYMDDQIGVRLDRRVRLSTGGTTSVPYSDHQFDRVGTVSSDGKYSTCEVDGDWTDTGRTKIKIDGVTNTPRVGQTFTQSSDAVNTYKVLASTTVSGGECEITITPSIGPANIFEDGTVVTFKERPLVYIKETGIELKVATELSSFLTSGDDLTTSKGSTSPFSVFVGVPYDFEYEFSEQFIKSGDDSINSGRLQMRNFEIAYAKTGYFEVEVSPKPYDARQRTINTSTFTGQIIGSLVLGQKDLETGVFRVPVYCNSKDVKIKVQSDQWFPLALQSADWEAFQVLRNQRI